MNGRALGKKWSSKKKAKKKKTHTQNRNDFLCAPILSVFFLASLSMQCNPCAEDERSVRQKAGALGLMHFVFMNGIIDSSKEIRNHFFFLFRLLNSICFSFVFVVVGFEWTEKWYFIYEEFANVVRLRKGATGNRIEPATLPLRGYFLLICFYWLPGRMAKIESIWDQDIGEIALELCRTTKTIKIKMWTYWGMINIRSHNIFHLLRFMKNIRWSMLQFFDVIMEWIGWLERTFSSLKKWRKMVASANIPIILIQFTWTNNRLIWARTTESI